MSTTKNAADIAVLTKFVNDVNSGKKAPSQLETATAFNVANDVALIIQGGVVKKINPNLLPGGGGGGTVQALFEYTATTDAESMFQLQAGSPLANVGFTDDGLWELIVNGNRYFSTNGIGSLTGGLVSVNFVNGTITFGDPQEYLNTGDKVILKYTPL